MEVFCEFCGKIFERSNRRYNEAIKFHWKQYCSLNCQKNAKQKNIELICSYQECKKLFTRKLSQVLLSNKLFCSKSCSAKYYAKQSHQEHMHTCAIPGCNNIVISIDNRKRYCSPGCLKISQKMSSYSADSVIKEIRGFYQKYDRIPLKYEMKYLYAPARQNFGSWNKAVIVAGYKPNPVMFANKHIARDGHQCDSLAEKIVDDWLSARNIKHKIHVPYPWHNGMKCDFWVNETWIEVFGLAGQHKTYDALKKSKLSLIRQHKLKLISLSLNDVYRDGLEKKLIKLSERRHHPS